MQANGRAGHLAGSPGKAAPLVVIAAPEGRLCNRLWLFANFIGNSLEYGYELANPAFREYARYFEHLRGDLFCRYPPRPGRASGTLIRRLVYELVRWPLRSLAAAGVVSTRLHSHLDIRHFRGDVQAFELRGPEWRSALRKRVVFAEGLEFRDWESLVVHKREIVDFLAPGQVHAAAALGLAGRARADSAGVLCGIHIRQGDYRRFLSGRWFYAIEDYIAKMRECQELFRGLAPVRFLVCSDAQLPRGPFQGLPATFGSGHFMEDLFALSRCDYLLGPPSTYSAWASYYGDVPLRFLFDLQPLKVRSFVPVTERLRRRIALAAELGADVPHTGFLEMCRDQATEAAG